MCCGSKIIDITSRELNEMVILTHPNGSPTTRKAIVFVSASARISSLEEIVQ